MAIVGAPYDMGTQVRSGARYGPRGIRNASAIYGMRSVKYYDSEFDEVYLDGVTIVDVGDADMIHGRPDACLANIQATTEKILERGAMPVTLGGDHAVPIPILRAFRDRGPICVVQIDAHLDFVDNRFGVTEGHGNVMRRILEMDHVTGIAQLGIRGPGSSDPQDFYDAKAHGQRDHRPARVPADRARRSARAHPQRAELLRDDGLRRVRRRPDAGDGLAVAGRLQLHRGRRPPAKDRPQGQRRSASTSSRSPRCTTRRR